MGAKASSNQSQRIQYIEGLVGPNARATLRFPVKAQTRMVTLCLPIKLSPRESHIVRRHLLRVPGL